MKSGDAPESPNPAVTIPMQGAENRKTFNYQLGQTRTNTTGPTGSQTWSKVPSFDEAGYNKALADWQAANTQPQWIPGANPSDPNAGQRWDPGAGVNGAFVPIDPGSGGAPGYWQPGTISGSQPSREDFTNYDWTLNTVLSPEQQALYESNTQLQQGQANAANMLLGQVQSGLGSPLDFSGLPGMSSGDFSRSDRLAGQADDYLSGLADRSIGDNFNQTLADAVYRQQTRYLDPQLQRQEEAMRANLADQGFTVGTPGFGDAYENFYDTSNRAYGSARDSAIAQGYNQGNTQLGLQQQIAQLLSGAQSGAFGQATQGANLQNQVRSQALQELLTQRNQPLNELAALRGGIGVSMPGGDTGAGGTPNLNPTDIMGALDNQFQGQLGQYGANVAGNNATASNIGGLLTALMMFAGSDRRFKTDITPTGETIKGIPLYTFRYIGGEVLFKGVMADEAEKILPEAVFRDAEGYGYVNYGVIYG